MKKEEKQQEEKRKKNAGRKKEEFEALKKTAEAHKTLSEEESEKKAKEPEKITEELLEEENDKEVKTRKAKAERDAVEKELAEKAAREKGLIERGKEGLLGWEPITKLGREVKDGKITDIDEILGNNRKILEEQIVDSILDVKTDLILIGQAKGKFGGGKRRAWRQTQKKTKEGNVPAFSSMAVTGDGKGHIGIGIGKAKETLPARDKAIRKSKINIIKIKRACSSFDCTCGEPHTGKEGSVKVTLIPAPQGTDLVVGSELKKILKLAGIKDVYSRSSGKRQTTFNLIKACFNALKKTNRRIKK